MDELHDHKSFTARRIDAVLLAAGLILLAAVAVRAAHSIRHDNALNFVSGAWIALARDLSEGIFYRPLVAEDGLGGTRFFPLQFMSHAVLIRFGVDPFVAGHILSITWTLMLLIGIYIYLRRAGASRIVAAGGALLPLCSSAFFTGLVDIRGDVLPAALNVWALALCLSTRNEDAHHQGVVAPVLLFTLAFAAKVTTLFGAVAACAALLFNGRRAAAARLAALCAIGYCFVLALMYLASDGRIVEIFRACAAGGTGTGYFLQSPVWMFSHQLAHDPIGFAIVVLALGTLAGLFGVLRRDLASLALLTTLAGTLFIFGSPGTSFNHLIDLSVIAVIFLIVQTIRGRLTAQVLAGIFVVISLVSAAQHLDQYRDSRASSRRFEMRQAVVACGDAAGPILSEDPLIPLLAGQRPYLLDSWMVRVISQKQPSMIQRLNGEISARKFRAIVLLTDPDRGGGKFLEDRVFGEGFVAALNQHYEKSRQAGRFAVYLPR